MSLLIYHFYNNVRWKSLSRDCRNAALAAISIEECTLFETVPRVLGVGFSQNDTVPPNSASLVTIVIQSGLWQGFVPTAAISARYALAVQITLAEVEKVGFWQH
jgi:hypothetical protein